MTAGCRLVATVLLAFLAAGGAFGADSSLDHGGLSFGSWDVALRVGVPRALDSSSQTIPLFAFVGASYAPPL